MYLNNPTKKSYSTLAVCFLVAAIIFSMLTPLNIYGDIATVYAEDNSAYGYIPGPSGGSETQADGSIKYWFPNQKSGYTSDHVYIRLTLSTTADNMFYLNTNGYNASTVWNGDYGVIHSWSTTDAFPTAKRSYETVKKWGNVSCWKNDADTVTVTYDLNRKTKKLKVFADNGASFSVDMVNDNSTTVTLQFVEGTTQVDVEYGEVVSSTAVLTDSAGNTVEDITDIIGDTAYITAYGALDDDYDEDNVLILYGIYDQDGRCIAADSKRVGVTDNKYHIALSEGFCTTIPDDTAYIKLFVWSGNTLKPIASYGYFGVFPENCEVRESTTVLFDGTSSVHRVVLSEEYPLLKLSEVSEIIGGDLNGATLTKDDISVTYTENSRLATSGDGHIMLETEPVKSGNDLYVPISSLMPILGYTVFYNRFDNKLEITTGTNYPKSQQTFYAVNYGAVGDGVTDDGAAITHVINAAINSGVPSTVMLEKDKTYSIGERADYLQYFHLEGVSNLTIDGNGSELVFKNCTNTFLKMDACTNVTVKNLKVDYEELPFTQGRVSNINPTDGTFEMEIDEGYPLPAVDEWVYKYWTDTRTGKWWFGQFMDSQEDRLKFTMYDNYFIDSVKKIDNGRYLLTAKDGYKTNLKYIETGDRFVLNTRFSAYDIGDKTSDGTTSMIEIWESGDITFDNVTLYASPGLGVSVGLCWGRIRFNHFGEETKPGRLLCVNSDGIHYWRNRAGVVVENSKFMNSLDDHINTKGEDAVLLEMVDDYTYVVDYDLNYRVGDELIFFDTVSHNILAKAYLKDFSTSGDKYTLTLDRAVSGTVIDGNADGTRATMVYNVDSSGRGSIVRNNTFIYSRRHAYISRSQNSIFEGNNVIDCGGSGLIAKNEIMSTSSEGPFPSSFTMRNNNITSKGNTYGYYPVEVKSWKATAGSTKAIDGFLIEGNEISVPNKYRCISIESVKDLYIIDNKLSCSETLETSTMPIYITNSEIALIDGVDLNYTQNVDAVITIDNSIVSVDNIKNVNTNGNTATAYKIK